MLSAILPLGILLSVLSVALPQASAPASRPSPQAPPVADAHAKLRAGDYAGAAAGFRAILETKPEHPDANYLLGYALHAQGKYAEALALHEKAARFPATAAMASYNAACAHALLGHADAAFHWLEKARAAGFNDFFLLTHDTDLNSLADDPRWKAYKPGGLDLARPFAEERTILYDFVGETPGDQFGWIARAIGDFDRDGVVDFASTAPFHNGGQGAVYVYSGRTGALRIKHMGKSGEQLGWTVAGAQDIDGDGRAEYVIGAPGGPTQTGRAVVIRGRDHESLFELSGTEPGERFGEDVAGVGDQDGDGVPDLLIGAPKHDGTGADTGRVALVSGKSGTILKDWPGSAAGAGYGDAVAGCGGPGGLLAVSATSDGGKGKVHVVGSDGLERFTIELVAGSRKLGWFVSVIPDIDGDGAPDIYATDWQDCSRTLGAGRIVVASGKDGRTKLELFGRSEREGFGIGVAGRDDLDGDGAPDLVVGAWQNCDRGAGCGRVAVHSGRGGAVIGEITGVIPGDALGFDADTVGDVNGDGIADLLITSAYSYRGATTGGRAYVVSGAFCRKARSSVAK
ncbi:MAG: FG-GAP repeat protein [Planctomycetes bacterium]|nr:FG-GAP repeat protein [Planctomycetota bacterium]